MKKTIALLLAAIMLLACIPASLAETKEISVMIQYRDIDDLDFANMPYFNDPEYFSKVNMPPHRIEKTTYCEAYDEAGVIEKNSWNILSKLITFNVEESTQRSLLHAEIDKYAKESLANFIVKGVTDESWAAYENTLKNIRLEDYIALYQTAYDRYVEANQ